MVRQIRDFAGAAEFEIPLRCEICQTSLWRGITRFRCGTEFEIPAVVMTDSRFRCKREIRDFVVVAKVETSLERGIRDSAEV